MLPTRDGSFHLFKLLGIDVLLHWTWFVVAVYGISERGRAYSSLMWNVLEYVGLFAIVLMHEFGHALACRQVGGHADQIVLWPLGGVAYVSPPQRPGAVFWSIAAGPLVNVLLLPILTLLYYFAGRTIGGDVYGFIKAMWTINLVLLIFNMLPVYPLDGGQILRALLWFPLGQARSLMVAASIGMFGVALLLLYALSRGSLWTGIIAVFILLQCWRGFQEARMLTKSGIR